MLLFYDSETTGMPKWSEPSESEGQPRIVQLAAILTDDHFNEKGSMSTLIEPDGFKIPEEAVAIHGITTEMASDCGVNIDHALSLFFDLYQHAGLRIGHNESFDARMIRIEMKHPDAAEFILDADDWKAGESYCTMHKSRPIVQLQPTDKMKGGFKVPELGEAYEFFTKMKFLGAHDAMADTRAALVVYQMLQQYEDE